MARVNNPVVGTLDCSVCGELATLHQTRRGKGQGLLYKRCSCGCDQRTGQQIQTEWRQQMQTREGFEALKIEPETTEPEPAQQPNEEPETQPETTETAPVPAAVKPPKGGGLLMLMLGVSVALLTLGKSGGPLA